MNKKGFTLVEVLLGMMILTIAIVLATNLFLTAMRSNKVMTYNLKAYYLAQEGIELTRNIRDTHWLHNLDWLDGQGDADPTKLEKGKIYSINFKDAISDWTEVDQISGMYVYFPWVIASAGNTDDASFNPYNEQLKLDGNDGVIFYRHINVLSRVGGDSVLIQSVVNFEDGGKKNEVILEEVLTNWKKGVL